METLYFHTIQTIWFCLSFYFTFLRLFTHLKIFDLQLNSLPSIFPKLNERFLFFTIVLPMWIYQIYFWFHYINVI